MSTATLTAPALPEITTHDRCDSCLQPARSVVEPIENSYLYFCGHHWRKNSSTIKESGIAFFVQDGEDSL